MKRIAMAALAMITLLGFTGCDAFGTKTTKKATVTLSDWKIKGSFDSWTLHQFTADEGNANKLTFAIDNLYAIDYEFVLVDPSGTEVKYSTDDNVTPGTAFTLGGSKNISFTAAKKAYTLEVDVTNATAPTANLIGGTDDAMAVTNAILADALKIKGDAFSIGWTETAGTFDSAANTVTWDVTYNNKNGTFGFSSMDNFLQGVTLDLSGLTAGGAGTTATDLLTSGGNAKLTGAPKAESVYTIVVTLDAAKKAGAGKYLISAKLKTLGTSDWKFDVPASIFPTGDLTGGWNEKDDATKRPTVSVTSGKATYSYTATAAGKVGFKFAIKANSGWDGLIGFSGVTTTGTTVKLYDDGGNLAFDAVKDTTYTLTVDFTGDYPTTGKPLVTLK